MKIFILTIFFVSLLLQLGIAYPNAVAAAENNVVITQIFLGASGESDREYIVLHNSSNQDIDVTNWCLEFASSASYREIVCLSNTDKSIRYHLESKGFVLITSLGFATHFSEVVPDFVFTNNSNIPGTNGSIRLVDDTNSIVDVVGWRTGISEGSPLSSLSSGLVFDRRISESGVYVDSNNNRNDFVTAAIPSILPAGGVVEVVVEVDVCMNIDGVQVIVPEGFDQDEVGDCFVDICLDIEGLQKSVPTGFFVNEAGECEMLPLENRVILITELHPNTPSVDTGNEFIELYNPNNESVNLSGYRLQVGPSYTEEFVFYEVILESQKYLHFSDTQTKIVLPNSSGVQLQLVAPSGDTVSESAVYSNALETNSWALIDDQWLYTNQITPGASNKPFLEAAVNEVSGVTSTLAPCAEGKYRNPETNRCRTIETAVSLLAPCDEDQYRNPETNRCRSITTASSSLTPCKPGQTRNPETNRCRNNSTSSGLTLCGEGQERNPETNRCRNVSSTGDTASGGEITDVATKITTGQINWLVILIAVGGTLGYMAYEWRQEMQQLFSRIRLKLVQ